MRKVLVIYDDSISPDAAVRSITGSNSFGNTIFKRVSLKEHMKESVLRCAEAEDFIDAADAPACINVSNAKSFGAMLIYSCFIITDADAFGTLLTKAVYAHENFRITSNGKTAGYIFYDMGGYGLWDGVNGSSYAEIKCDAFTDISEIGNFRQFITSGFEARFFNSLSGDEYTLTKKSEKINKIKAEHDFYYMLPEAMKQWFVRPYDLRIAEGFASYKMERFHMADLAIRYVHGAIKLDEFADILGRLFYFAGIRYAKDVSETDYEAMARSLYIDKVRERIQALKESKEYNRLETLIAELTDYSGLDDIVNDYLNLYSNIRSGRRFRNILVVSHGDMCFSNILYNHETSMLKLIDPKGAVSEDDMYTDPYYDLAKLSHSVCGRYDFFNSDLYDISIGEDMRAVLTVDFDNREYVEMFKSKLAEAGIDYRLVRLYECSLFLSMLPLHIDRPKKVFAFILNAINIIKELKEN